MKVYYIAWCGVPCAEDGSALCSGNGYTQCGSAKLEDVAVFLEKSAAEKCLSYNRRVWLGNFSIEEVEIEGVGD